MEAKWAPKGEQSGAKRSKRNPKGPKGHPLRNKNEQMRKRVRRSMQIDAKRVLKWSRKQCKNTLKLNAKAGTEQMRKFTEILFF